MNVRCVRLVAVLAGALSPAGMFAQAPNYQITQVTTGDFDHKWPSINNKGDIVWSQQVGGLWQAYLLKKGQTMPTPISVPNTNHNFEYPDIDDSGNVVYLEDGEGAGPGLSVVENIGGTESTIEYSSGNPPGCTEPPAGPATCSSWRAAGQHFGISSKSMIISYHDFCNPGCTRNFDVSGTGQLTGTYNGDDYPDINMQGFFVYTSGASIFRATTALPTTATMIATGSNPRIADGAPNQEVVYISGGQVVSTARGTVAAGIWADIGASGTIVFEAVVNGFSQVFLAVPPVISLSPSSLTFPEQVVLTSSKSMPVALVNLGPGNLTLKNVAATGDYSVGTTCPGTVPPQTGCTINVTFKPSAAGARKGTLNVTDDGLNSPQKVSLKGVGTFIGLSPASLTFPSQPVGTAGMPKKITLTNTGTAAVTITSVSITGTDPSDFSQTNTCGSSVVANGTCTISVTFKPTATGGRSAKVSIADSDGGSPQTAALSGTGT